MKYGICFMLFITVIFSQNNDTSLKIANKIARKDALSKLHLQIGYLPLSTNVNIKVFLRKYELENEFRAIYTNYIEQIGAHVDAGQKAYKITIAITLKDVVKSLEELFRKHEITDKTSISNLQQYSLKIFYATGSIPINSYHLDESSANEQGKKLAVRLAQMDACKNLKQIIRNMNLSRELKVNDFISENSDIYDAFSAFIRQSPMKLNLQRKNLGIVEVIIEVETIHLADELRKICKKHYQGALWQEKHFYQLHDFTTSKKIIAKGKGVILNKEKQKRLQTIYIPQWANKTLVVTGESFLPQIENKEHAQKMGMERAQADGYHKLIVKIMELPLPNKVALRKLIERNIMIRNNISSAIKRAKTIELQQTQQVIRIKLELYLAEIWRVVAHVYWR